jgi:hypothetical protein
VYGLVTLFFIKKNNIMFKILYNLR